MGSIAGSPFFCRADELQTAVVQVLRQDPCSEYIPWKHLAKALLLWCLERMLWQLWQPSFFFFGPECMYIYNWYYVYCIPNSMMTHASLMYINTHMHTCIETYYIILYYIIFYSITLYYTNIIQILYKYYTIIIQLLYNYYTIIIQYYVNYTIMLYNIVIQYYTHMHHIMCICLEPPVWHAFFCFRFEKRLSVVAAASKVLLV